MLKKASKKLTAGFAFLAVLLSVFGTVTFAESTILQWPASVTGTQMPFSPEDKSVCIQNPPDFRWPYIEGADNYHIQIGSNADMTVVSYEADNISGNFYNFPVAFETGTWYWRVRYYKTGEWSDWSLPRRFRIEDDAFSFPVPAIQDFISLVRQDHPRVWANADTLANFRTYASTKGKSVYESKRAIVNTNLSKPMPAEPYFPYDPNGPKDAAYIAALNQLTSYSMTAIDNMLDAAFVYLVSEDVNIGQNAKNQLLNLISWNPNGSTSYIVQDQVHRSIAYKSAMAYDWLYDLLTAEERQSIVNLITLRTNVMVDDLLNSDSMLKYPYNSHGWTALGYIGITSLALLHDSPDAEQWFRKSVPAYINLLTPWGGEDGGYSQGTGYWQWGSLFNKEFMDVLLSSCGINLYDKAYSKNEKDFLLYAFPNGSPMGIFGDDSEYAPGAYNTTMYKRLAEMYGDSHLQWGYLNSSTPPVVFLNDYFYGDSSLEARPPVELPNAKWFEDIGWVTMHSNLYDPERVSLYFKSSPYGSYNHSHADQNSFIINAYGETLAMDSGYYDWYISNHHSNYTRRTFAHNAITYDGKNGQSVDSMDAKGKITGFVTHPDFDSVSGDALEAYAGGLSKADRHIIYIRPSMFVVVDNLASPKAGGSNYTWWLHAKDQITVDEDQAGATTINGNAVLKTKVYSPAQIQAAYEERFLDVNGTEVRPEGRYAFKPDQKHVSFTTEKAEATTIVTLMDVYKKGSSPANVVSENLGNYVKLTFEDGTQVYARLTQQGEIDTGTYKFEGAAITVKGDTVMLVSGTKLKQGETTLLESSYPATVVIGQEQLMFSSLEDGNIKVYAPGTMMVKNEQGTAIPKAGNILENLSQRGVHWDTNGDELVLNVNKGSYLLKLNQAPIPQPLADTILNIDLDGVLSTVQMKTYSDIGGNPVSWGKLTIQEGLYEVVEAPGGLVFEKYGTQKVFYSETNPSVILSGQTGILRMKSVASNQFSEIEVRSDYDSVRDTLTEWKEAEGFSSSGGGAFSVYTNRPFLSGGVGVGNWANKGQWIKWSFTVPRKAKYDVVVKYVAGWGLSEGQETTRYMKIGDGGYVFGAPTTADYGTKPEVWRSLRIKINQELDTGRTDLVFWNALGPMNMDWVGLIEVKDDEISPTIPDNLRLASKTENTVDLAWDPSTDNTGIKGYEVYMDGVKQAFVNSGNSSYTMQGLTAGKKYSFAVRAVDMYDNYSRKSSELVVITNDITPPLWGDRTLRTPFILNSRVRVSWSFATDNSGTTNKYIVYIVEDGIKTKITETANLYADVDMLQGDRNYTFKVEAVDLAGNETLDGPSETIYLSSTATNIVGFYESFDTMPSGQMLAGNGWQIAEYAEYGKANVVDLTDGTGKALKLYDNDYDTTNEYRNAVAVERSMEPLSGKLVFETRFKVNKLEGEQNQPNFDIIFFAGAQKAIRFLGYSGGCFGFKTVDDSSDFFIPSGGIREFVLPTDQWIDLKIDMDTSSKKYDLMIHADALKGYSGSVEGQSTLDRDTGTFLRKGIPFYTSFTEDAIRKIYINLNRYKGEMTFDHMLFYKEDAVFPDVSLNMPLEVKPLEEFDAVISLENASGTAAEDISLTYDSGLFELIGIESVGTNSLVSGLEHNLDQAAARFVNFHFGTASTVHGNADIVKVRFKAKDIEAVGNISLTHAVLADAVGREYEILTLNSKSIAIIDKTQEYLLLSQAKSLYDNAVEGIENGKYIPNTLEASKISLSQAIIEADTALNGNCTLDVLKQITLELEAAIYAFEELRVIAKTGDINNSGIISIGDLALAAGYYGVTSQDTTTWPDAKYSDINRDGIVDILDLAFIARRIML